jgi:hypothetical protein
MKLPIVPIESFGRTATLLDVCLLGDSLSTDATGSAEVRGIVTNEAGDNFGVNKFITISGEDYANWTGDSETVHILLAEACGVEIAPAEELPGDEG